jgi:CheY-like chemotaxis protein
MTIMAVDDDSDDLEFFSEAITTINPNFKFIKATDGFEALSILETTQPDVLFLDINMPKMTGKECLEHIRTKDSLQKIPVVMYTTGINPNEALYYAQHKVMVLQKASSMKDTISSLENVLKGGLDI